MKFIIVTQGDILYTPIFFREFFAADYAGTCKGVMVQEPLGNKSMWGLIKRMLAFYGPLDFMRQGFTYVYKKLRAKGYEWNLIREPVSIENMARHHNVPVLSFTSVNNGEFKQWVRDQEIDLIVSIAASELFDEEVLELPTHGCINFHNAPLPHYRGMLPNFWQMHHGEEFSVLTVHTMTEALDKGEIVYQQKTPIKSGYSLEDLIRLTKKKSAGALVEVLRQFHEKEVSYAPMPDEEGSYYTFPGRSDVREFKSKGKRLF
ncbi:formyl transferase [Balneolaceae bacterium YR4-1]|uniref:Formyl transferase n=1 Tax=Halalkalibaculum roseum TaxID=2709311 RepID=A0A6M1SSV2_9BACT|nr:formyltransferase family protein [Halalkalibaculum roseum]NGP75950.1 formyl transferase [Halalkalibaculum roseum]